MRSLIFLALASLSASAAAFTIDDVEFWVGSGSNRSVFVVDFQANTPSSFAWGFRWDGDATGADALRAVEAADWNLSGAIFGSGAGTYLDSMTYHHPTTRATYEGATWPNGWWSFWTKTPGSDWVESQVGAGSTTLTNEGWTAWSYNVGTDFNPPAPNEPGAAPVPEPATLAALGLGALALLRRRVGSRR